MTIEFGISEPGSIFSIVFLLKSVEFEIHVDVILRGNQFLLHIPFVFMVFFGEMLETRAGIETFSEFIVFMNKTKISVYVLLPHKFFSTFQ